MKKIDLTGMSFGRLTVIEMIRSPGKDAKGGVSIDTNEADE